MALGLSQNVDNIPECLWVHNQRQDTALVRDILQKTKQKEGEYFSISSAYREIFSHHTDEYFLYDTLV